MIRYHAAWILPISEPPIRDGWFACERGRIVAYGSLGPAGRTMFGLSWPGLKATFPFFIQ